MTWNNRIFRHRCEVKPGVWEDHYSIHEVYYDEENKGKIISWTENPIEPFGETVDGLIEHLEQMLNDVKRSKDDILDYDSDGYTKEDYIKDELEVPFP